MSQNQTNTTISMSANWNCKACKIKLEPIRVPAIPLLGIKESVLQPAEFCETCYQKREVEEKLKQDRERIRQSFSDSMMTTRFLEKKFENFKVNEKNRMAYEAAVNFEISEDGRGILFFGSYGIGKTHLAAAIANKLIGEIPLLYISCPDLLAEIRDAINTKGQPNRLNIAKNAKLLILDDIGAERPSEWVQETLFLLINHRYEFKLPTIFTTNCSMKQLEEKLGGRIASRIAEMSKLIRFEGQDFRLIPKQDSKNKNNLNILK